MRKGRETVNLCRGECGRTEIFIESERKANPSNTVETVIKYCRECGWKRETFVPVRLFRRRLA